MIAVLAAALVAASAEPPSPEDAKRQMDELQSLYQQSCEVRAYASYDDVCEGLKSQLHDAQKAYRKAASRKPSGSAKPASATPAVAGAASAPAAPPQVASAIAPDGR